VRSVARKWREERRSVRSAERQARQELQYREAHL